MEVLFEYRGSRRQLTASSGDNLIECITTELQRVGRSRAQVYTANVDLSTIDSNREVYLLQRWSPQWQCYLDVNQASDISDGDKLAVVIKPKPPPKFLLLCCWCTGVQNEPQVQGIPRNKKNAVRKNEEIQALDYVFNVESSRHSRVSESEEVQSLAPTESKETDLNEGEQYIRSDSGRASWKLVPMKPSESSDVLPTTEDEQQEPREQPELMEPGMENNSVESIPQLTEEEPVTRNEDDHSGEEEEEDSATADDQTAVVDDTADDKPTVVDEAGKNREENPDYDIASETEAVGSNHEEIQADVEDGGVVGGDEIEEDKSEAVSNEEVITDVNELQPLQQPINDNEVKGENESQDNLQTPTD